jgi:predicted RNA binding protein YcfA (HicA-like mRNA interferase family)
VPKLSPEKPYRIIKALEKLGFKLIRQSGSHGVFRHSDGRWTTVPIHPSKDVSKGILRKIIKDAGIGIEEFNRLK